jgi:hypothetical protein
MVVGDIYYNQKQEFVKKLSEVLNFAKPHLSCEFKLGEEINKMPSTEYVVVTAENGYKYYINVSCNSLALIGEEVFKTMCGK